MQNLSEVDLTGKYAVLKEELFKDEYKDLRYRVVLCQAGFGCKPYLMGRAVYTKALYNGEESRWNRDDFERLATEEEIEQIKALKH